MCGNLFKDRPGGTLSILDPCAGPATFPKAMAQSNFLAREDNVTLIELDPGMVEECRRWQDSTSSNAVVIRGDYLELRLDPKYDVAILNPPYIRQEWIEKKTHYRSLFLRRHGIRIPGTSNLYVYFIVKVVLDLRPGGKFAAIVYDSWQSTKYGQWLRDFLHRCCDGLEIVVARDQPFLGRLIDATIIYGRKHKDLVSFPRFTTQSPPSEVSSPLGDVDGFRPLGLIFNVRRGLRLKQANFFLCDRSYCSRIGATPFVKKVGTIEGYRVPASHPEAALLISAEYQDSAVLAELKRRIELAKNDPDRYISILTWFKERPDSWFLHRRPPRAPLIFNYYIRRRPRHILNPVRAYADNFYGLTPPPRSSRLAWLALLNSTATCTEVLANARNQGNGLAKIQLFEYRRANIPDLSACTKQERQAFAVLGQDLIGRSQSSSPNTLRRIDSLVASVFSDSVLRPSALNKLFIEFEVRARAPRKE